MLALALALGTAADAGTPRFRSSVGPIDEALREQMTSWRPGCPVPLGDLRLVTVTHWGFDGKTHTGRLIVHVDSATAMVGAMRSLFAARFPIRRMRLVDAYGSDDHRSMAADNTSAFNCRRVSGSSSWSQHAYGRAIDINPVENPYVSGTHVSPPAGAAYADRTRRAPGMIHRGDAVVRAFASVGWRWGGDWYSPKDYQHFSATGS
jgi:D-alanyl-D-alanine carboxypeptidase-like protein